MGSRVVSGGVQADRGLLSEHLYILMFHVMQCAGLCLNSSKGGHFR